MFSYVRLEEGIPADHPLRSIKAPADAALSALNRRFGGLYSDMDGPQSRRTGSSRREGAIVIAYEHEYSVAGEYQ
jgi:hypothetical protein